MRSGRSRSGESQMPGTLMDATVRWRRALKPRADRKPTPQSWALLLPMPQAVSHRRARPGQHKKPPNRLKRRAIKTAMRRLKRRRRRRGRTVRVRRAKRSMARTENASVQQAPRKKDMMGTRRRRSLRTRTRQRIKWRSPRSSMEITRRRRRRRLKNVMKTKRRKGPRKTDRMRAQTRQGQQWGRMQSMRLRRLRIRLEVEMTVACRIGKTVKRTRGRQKGSEEL
mmetsp:Transcript_88169/g.249834  ORF Transcript_88169/g.249834 Transcript_88169/m.249834 type:complete len:225 (-) Transcript_88169:1286-1960(-)